MEILKTKNYDLFKEINSNREVDQRHVRSLVAAIEKKNLLHVNPIVCNAEMEVIDGQHRLEAARNLSVEIYYTMDSEINEEDIARINSNSKNWGIMDYVNFWTIKKKPGFDRLSAFLSENPMIPASTALSLFSGFSSGVIKSAREGEISTSHYDFACEVAGVIKWYRNIIEFAYERNFIIAVARMMHHPEYSHETMISKVERQPRSLVRCINTNQYLEMLDEIYNYQSGKVSRIDFRRV